jgi:hypothetical protein
VALRLPVPLLPLPLLLLADALGSGRCDEDEDEDEGWLLGFWLLLEPDGCGLGWEDWLLEGRCVGCGAW